MMNKDNIIYKKIGGVFTPVGIYDGLDSVLSDGLWWIHTKSGSKSRTNYSWMTQLCGPERVKFSPKAICSIHNEAEELCKKFLKTHFNGYSMQEFADFILSNIYESDKNGTNRTTENS